MLYDRFLVDLECNDNDVSEIMMMDGLNGILKEFEEWLYAYGHIQQQKTKKFKLVEIKEDNNA